MSRVLIVSNRLPISVSRQEGQLRVSPSAGGLATGLRGVHEKSGGLWIGWPGYGGEATEAERQRLADRYRDLNLVPVELSPDEVERYYEQFCNGVLWPLLHYLIGELPLQFTNFDLYETVNRRFADAVVANHREGDTIWVHDYQLMLVPQMIRERLPEARIGFFLHIPFTSSEVFRILPFRESLLAGLLGADLIGFHTAAYMRHFGSSVLRTLGVPMEVDRLRWDGRTVRVGVFPMGVDVESFAGPAESEPVVRQVAAIRREAGPPTVRGMTPGDGDARILLGIDRLDYTKGIRRRLLAFEHFLRRHSEWRQRVRLIQVAVPSRTKVELYQDFREQLDGVVGRINGQFATPSWVPIHYMYRGLPANDVVALYRAADVMLVTPIRDGMNLVSKEFVAARTDEDGVLVLSEFAGASAELAEAVHINPYDVEGTADAIHRALTMGEDERRTRMQALRSRVVTYDIHRWARSFLARLAETKNHRTAGVEPTPTRQIEALVNRLRAAKERVLLIDYDGTLVKFAQTPELARPDEAVLKLLRDLAVREGNHVHIVSGRSRHTLERWLGALPVSLHAEHGLWSRPRNGSPTVLDIPPLTWCHQVLPILREYADRTPGSLVEEKPAGLAWHYRAADPEFGAEQAHELQLHLHELLSNTPVEILAGDHVVEIRSHGVNKGRVVPHIVAAHPEGLLVAIGDDRTDEDMFVALPPGSIAIHVGSGHTRAQFRLAAVKDVRTFLRALL